MTKKTNKPLKRAKYPPKSINEPKYPETTRMTKKKKKSQTSKIAKILPKLLR